MEEEMSTDVTNACYANATISNGSLGANCTNPYDFPYSNKTYVWTIINCVFWSLLFVVGLIGNGLVIFVVLTYAKMKTVTNMYILNLAVADLCFLVGLPFLIVTAILQRWIFGYVMCKIFYILTSINWFTSVFTLTVMSADRYLAVCHPVSSMKYRTPIVSRIVCAVVWTVSLLVMLPIMMYARLMYAKPEDPTHASCTLRWPQSRSIPGEIAFIWYALLLGFAIPVALISVFYALVVVRLRSVGPKRRTKEKKKSHRKVTKMVLTIIAVYVICWLPYWVFQAVLSLKTEIMPPWTTDLFQIITVLSYANSMLNPLLYAFLSDNFRKSFIKAFKCATVAEVNGTLQQEHSVFPGKKLNSRAGTKPQKLRQADSDEDINLTTSGSTTTTTVAPTKNDHLAPPPVYNSCCSNSYATSTAILSGSGSSDNGGATPVTEV